MQIKKRFKSRRLEVVTSECGTLANDVFEPTNSEVREVFLDIDARRHNYGRRATLSEKLFGIILSPLTRSIGNDSTHCNLVVSGIIPHAEAHKEGTIQTGDWLKSIDDIEVTSNNLDYILQSFTSPKQVKLLIQRSIGKTRNSDELCKVHENINSLFEYFAASIDSRSKLNHFCLPYAVSYLCVKSESKSEDTDDVIYYYPNIESQLFKLNGTFITLGHMISNVATPPILSCSVRLQEKLNVCFIMEGSQMMIVAAPLTCATVAELQHIAIDVAKLLKFQFSTLSQAFGDTENTDYLNQLFGVFFHQLMLPTVNEKCKFESRLLHILPSVHWFPLPSDIKIVVDDILSQFESADFGDMSEGYYGIRRIYNIMGSCLFYKGYLLGSHLNKEDLLDAHLFLRYHGLLSLTKTQPVSRAIIWKEVYPSRRQHIKHTSCEPNYDEADGRYFLLIVAMSHSILATLLEAGGCALSVSGFPSPEPFYVDLVENTLLLFEDSGVLTAVGKLLCMQDPQLGFPDVFLRIEEKRNWEILSNIVGLSASASGRARRSRSYSNLYVEECKKSREITNILKKSFDHDFERQQLLSNMGPADGESDEESDIVASQTAFKQHLRRYSASTSSNTGSHGSDENIALQSCTVKTHFNSSYDLRSMLSNQEHQEITTLPENVQKCIVSPSNTLFHYLHMDPVEGVFLAPTMQMQKLLHGSLRQDIVQAFYSCCMQMRTTFERSLRNKELFLNSVVLKCGLNSFLRAAYEQGALFHCNTVDEGSGMKKTSLSMTFWVIGRIFFTPEPREVYVCYHDSVPHNVVEFAFRLGFGLSL